MKKRCWIVAAYECWDSKDYSLYYKPIKCESKWHDNPEELCSKCKCVRFANKREAASAISKIRKLLREVGHG